MPAKSILVRILEWNRKRNGLKFDPILETRLLTEEANEFAMATTTAERLREYCDFMFVVCGTRCKYLASRLQSADALINTFNKWQTMKQWAVQTEESMWEILTNEGVTESQVEEALAIVIYANEDKPATKNEYGKVIKGDTYVDPIAAIKALIGEQDSGYEA